MSIEVEYKHDEAVHARGELCDGCRASLAALPEYEQHVPDFKSAEPPIPHPVVLLDEEPPYRFPKDVCYHDGWCRLQFWQCGCDCYPDKDRATPADIAIRQGLEAWLYFWGVLWHGYRCEYRSLAGARCWRTSGHDYHHAGRANGIDWQESIKVGQ